MFSRELPLGGSSGEPIGSKIGRTGIEGDDRGWWHTGQEVTKGYRFGGRVRAARRARTLALLPRERAPATDAGAFRRRKKRIRRTESRANQSLPLADACAADFSALKIVTSRTTSSGHGLRETEQAFRVSPFFSLSFGRTGARDNGEEGSFRRVGRKH